MSYSLNEIHDALLESYLAPSDLLIQKAISEHVETRTYIDSILSEIQPRIDAMKFGGHHSQDFEQELFNKISDYASFDSATSKGHTASLFVDLTDFTTRTFHEDIEDIARLKRAAIQTWMVLALYNDGHIHSITGDGLMILFSEQEDFLENTLRAFATGYNFLMSMEKINERLQLVGSDRLRIKVGLDYCDEVVWNVCGLVNSQQSCVGEVKATGFGVDFSAKLMAYNSSIIRGTNINHNELIIFGNKACEILTFKKEYFEEYKSQPEQRPTAPYKRTKNQETKFYKIFYADVKEIKKQVNNDLIKYQELAILLDNGEEEPVFELPPSSDTMYA